MSPTTVAMSLESVFEAAQAYVMLSRVQQIDQLFIVGSLDEDMFETSEDALKELKRLESISFNKNPSSWHKEDTGDLKIATLNCAGLLPHFRDIVKDDKLLQGQIVNLIETSLPADADTTDIAIKGFSGQFINVGNGKGVCSFVNCGVTDFVLILREEETLQVAKYEFEDLDVIALYRYIKYLLFEFNIGISFQIKFSQFGGCFWCFE